MEMTHRAAKPGTARAKAKKDQAHGDSLLNLSEAVNQHITPEQVAERAYFRWLERGCPMGTAEQDWFEAERELRMSK
jgi:hypothetical protein